MALGRAEGAGSERWAERERRERESELGRVLCA